MKVSKTLIALCLMILTNSGSALAEAYIAANYTKSTFYEPGFESDTGIKFAGGYFLNQYFGLDMAVTNLGEFEVKDEWVSSLGKIDGSEPNQASIDLKGIEFSAIAVIPGNEHWDFLVRLGLFNWKGELNLSIKDLASNEVASRSESKSGTTVFGGFGARIHVMKDIAIFGEFNRVSAYEKELNVIGLGLVYGF